jgi:hypothetical protein
LDDLLIEKRKVSKKIEYQTNQLQAVELIELLKQEIVLLTKEISMLETEIKQKEYEQTRNRQTAMQKIRENTFVYSQK